MNYKIEYIENDLKKEVVLKKDSYLIGKLPTNDLSILDNSISRQHCRLEFTKKGYRLVDLDSTNGTFVNGKRINRKKLKPGDEITIGRTIIRYTGSDSDTSSIHDIDDQQISRMVPLSDKLHIEESRELSSFQVNLFDSLTLIGKKLLSSLSLQESFEKVAESLFDILKPNSLYIFSCKEGVEELTPELIRQKGKKDADQVNISRSIAHKAISERVAILSSNTLDDSRFKKAESVIIYGIKSAISVPVWTTSSIYGLIYADITDITRTFAARDLEMVSIVANFLGLSIETINNRERLTYEKKLRNRLERYHSPGIAEQIVQMQKTDDDLMAHREVEASVLFLDIAGFTQRVEKIAPTEIAHFLNLFFTEMTDAIFKYDGTLDKYLGDGLMAVFGVPFEKENHAQLAIQAAVEMKKRVEKFNREQKLDDRIHIRIGIHAGHMICGDFGSPQRVDYTVLGNTVNIASRLESTIARPDQIVVSEEVVQRVEDKDLFEEIGEREIAGISKPVRVYFIKD
jgi:adenylate cyclase